MRAVSKAKNHSIAGKSLRRTIFFVAAILFAASTFDAYNQAQLAVVLILFIGVLSVTLLTGISGQLSLGQGALMAVGGYCMALLMINQSYSLWVAIPLAIVGSALAGLLLGIAAARLTGPYLAGTTLVIALAIPTLANRFMSVLKGDEGLAVDVGYPPVWFTNLFGEPSYEQWQLYVALPFAAIALFLASNILLSRTGRMWRAIRDNETAAALSGVNFSRQKYLSSLYRQPSPVYLAPFMDFAVWSVPAFTQFHFLYYFSQLQFLVAFAASSEPLSER